VTNLVEISGSEDQITSGQQRRLNDAYGRLRAAVADNESFVGQELKPGKSEPVHNLEARARAQAEVEGAERELWRLREEFLGWVRPSWAPGATLVADWFSDEDSIYDDMDPSAVR
jgi:hypothetical protein